MEPDGRLTPDEVTAVGFLLILAAFYLLTWRPVG